MILVSIALKPVPPVAFVHLKLILFVEARSVLVEVFSLSDLRSKSI